MEKSVDSRMCINAAKKNDSVRSPSIASALAGMKATKEGKDEAEPNGATFRPLRSTDAREGEKWGGKEQEDETEVRAIEGRRGKGGAVE